MAYHISQHRSLLQELEQRYSKMRVEVQMAQDADEQVSLEDVVRRVMRKERQTVAVLPGTRAAKNASKSAPPIPGGYSAPSLCEHRLWVMWRSVLPAILNVRGDSQAI